MKLGCVEKGNFGHGGVVKTLFNIVINNNDQARDNKEGYAYSIDNNIYVVVVQKNQNYT